MAHSNDGNNNGLTLQGFVTRMVDDAIAEYAESEMKNTFKLLEKNRKEVINYLVTQYPKVSATLFADHVVSLKNLQSSLESQFTPLLVILEGFALKMESNRKLLSKDVVKFNKVQDLITSLKARTSATTNDPSAMSKPSKPQRSRDPRKRKISPEPPIRSIFDNYDDTLLNLNTNVTQSAPSTSISLVKTSLLPSNDDRLSPDTEENKYEPTSSAGNEVQSDTLNTHAESTEDEQMPVDIDTTVNENDEEMQDEEEDDEELEERYRLRKRTARSMDYYFNRAGSSRSSEQPQYNASSDNQRGSTHRSERNDPQAQPYRSALDFVDDEDEEEVPRSKSRRLSFDNDVTDTQPRNERITVRVPLNVDHQAVDHKVFVSDCVEDSFQVALPNQPQNIGAPQRRVFEKWENCMLSEDGQQTPLQGNAKEILSLFHYNLYIRDKKKRPMHLILHDSILDNVDFFSKFDRTEQISIGYPHDPKDVISALKVEARYDDFIIHRIYICLGLDYICYFPDFSKVPRFIVNFLDNLAGQVRKAFRKDGPPRYNGHQEPVSIEVPKFVIITIPYIQNVRTATYSHEIKKVNDVLRHYVNSKKNDWLKNYGHDIELYDWEKSTSKYSQCNQKDLEKRYRVLTSALAQKYQVFMSR